MTCAKACLMSSVFVIYVISLTLAAQTKTCLLECMRDMLECQRFEELGLTSQMECCDSYTLCFFLCQPDAITSPSCDRREKRGSWNKRRSPQDNRSNRGWFNYQISKDDDKSNELYS